MKIVGTGTTRSTQLRRADRNRVGGSGDFASELTAESGTRGIAAGTPVDTVDAMLALQEVPDAATANARGQRRAETILDRLEELRDGLLLGSFPRQRLDDLARLARDRKDQVDDPRLRQVLKEIELRAAVELEKLAYLGRPR